MTRTQWAIIVALAASIAIIFCGGIGLLANRSAPRPTPIIIAEVTTTSVSISRLNPTNTPQPTPQPSYTPLPSSTPTLATTPTRTSIPTRTATWTITPKPSATSRPSITPSPTRGYSAADLQYATDIHSIALEISDVSTKFAKLSDAASKNPMLMRYINCLNSQWCIDMATVLAGFTAASTRIRELNPPPLFASVHKDYLDSASHIDSFVDLYSSSLDEMNIAILLGNAPNLDKMNRANQEVILATAAISRANVKIDKISGQ